MPVHDNQGKTASLSQGTLLGLSAIVTAIILCWLLRYSRYGIDFTDESFYVVWMSNPFNYSVSLSQFGFVYHPLYKLFDGNIAALRQANILITFCLAWVLSTLFLKSVFDSRSLHATPRLIIAGAIATGGATSLVFGGLWLPTPSYNSLAMQATLLAAIGLLLARRDPRRSSIVGWFLIGAGVWLAFMAKPTTAAGLGVCVAFYLLAAGMFSARLLLVSVSAAVGLLVLSALAIDGSIAAFVHRVQGGLELARMLDPTYTSSQLLRLDKLEFGRRAEGLLAAVTAAIFLAAYCSQARHEALARSSTALSIAFALTSLAIILGFTHRPLDAGRFQGLLLLAVPFAAILTGLSMHRVKGLFQIPRSQWALALTFLTLPYVYAFGTGNNYWIPIACAGIFFVLAGLVFLTPVAPRRTLLALLLPLGLAVQLISVALVHSGIETPYRQPQPLRENDYKLDVGRPGSELVLSQGFGRYMAEAVTLANQSGLAKGTPVIDLTGRSPGLLYVLGATNIGQAWAVGGYPGSNQLAAAMLRTVACEQLSRAWLLVEPDSPIRISPEVLSSFGANLAKDFEIAGTLKTAAGAGGHEESRVQQLLKPVRPIDAAMTACAAGRP